MKLTAMELTIVQKNDKGIFGGPYINDFEFTYQEVVYRVRIEQCLKRILYIGTEEKVHNSELVEMGFFLERLLFLFDGRFYPIEEVTLIDEKEDPELYRKETEKFFDNRLALYNSIDICRNSCMRLINFEEVDFEAIIPDWDKLHGELDIAFNMFLYCLSDIQLPVDCKIASVIEFAKPIGEIVEQRNSSIKIEKDGNGLILRSALSVLIENYGAEVFQREINSGFKEFVALLVNTRNKIAHIKSFRNKSCLDGVQCIFYLAKLSLFYRKIIFELLNVDNTCYLDDLQAATKALDDWYYGIDSSE